MAAKLLQKIVLKTPSLVQFQATPHFLYLVKKHIGKGSLNIGLVKVRQKIKFNQYLTT